jgi:DNA-binding response OmpR family regulator
VSGKRILVVDDEPGVLEIVQINLEWEGYLVLRAQDGRQGLALAQEARPDLMILDVMMPEVSGWQVLQAIEADVTLAVMPVIMLSVVGDDEALVQGLEMGAVDYVTKPFNPVDLVHTVHMMLEDLDAQGRDAHRREIIERCKQGTHSLHQRFHLKREAQFDDDHATQP